MKFYSVYDPEFKAYGQVPEGYDTKELCAAMMKIDLPEGVNYEPGIDSLEACAIYPVLRDRAYGGMPIQLGLCWGHNTKLNCLEYHRDSEVNIGTHDFVLLLAKQDQIVDGVLDTALVKAFRVPAGVPVGTGLDIRPTSMPAAANTSRLHSSVRMSRAMVRVARE